MRCHIRLDETRDVRCLIAVMPEIRVALREPTERTEEKNTMRQIEGGRIAVDKDTEWVGFNEYFGMLRQQHGQPSVKPSQFWRGDAINTHQSLHAPNRKSSPNCRSQPRGRAILRVDP